VLRLVPVVHWFCTRWGDEPQSGYRVGAALNDLKMAARCCDISFRLHTVQCPHALSNGPCEESARHDHEADPEDKSTDRHLRKIPLTAVACIWAMTSRNTLFGHFGCISTTSSEERSIIDTRALEGPCNSHTR
jgi:hypothetical protein